MIVFGIREKKIDLEPVLEHSCNHCSVRESLLIQINCIYFHVFWIPVFPVYKKTYSICSHCRKVLTGGEMPPDLNATANELKKEAKYPWYVFTGSCLALLLLIIAFFISK
ncbi:zinc-ribbon domain-containing protein [Chitinophaga barathri]|nr:zinc-ribbon domain-containing protein [Chitinophaga barathri]